MASSKINPSSQTNPDTGLGVQAAQVGSRFINKDGSFNLKKTGASIFTRGSIYPYLLELSRLHFVGLTIGCYLLINLVYTALYWLVGIDQLTGIQATTDWGRIKEVFFFSTQSFTTVGYGRINPVGDGADILSSLETFTGWMFFAMVTGLLYGRFTRPKAYISFSNNALISPYQQGTALMFRMVPYKTMHYLSDVRVVVNLSLLMAEDGKDEYKFYTLTLERSRIDIFNMNWTVVHPIDANSPLLNFTETDIQSADLELMVQVSGFDPVFSNMVMHRTSYTVKELVWNAKFLPMYHESEDGFTTILELNKLNDYQKLKATGES
ncbi:MAG: transporter [Flaviaesturariibacter sp.]|nr:transporter [Flaviaesturariibacter sp.]